ncbi:uncharacterized protein [Euphorbia lathyris]|uniref:uncharacterized protein n=1 Tax=Euphorbia lathyris TaxID=212925 RepID=UPI003313CDFD
MLDPGTRQNFPSTYNRYRSSGEFGGETKLISDDDDDSGICSPPLWKTSSRAEAIAKGQKELMEMVSKMPEGCYELSLRDIVEQTVVDPVKEVKDQKNNKKVQMSRSGSIDNHHNGGFLLKMVFPISLGSTKKKKTKTKNISSKSNSNSNSGMNMSGRVSPRPLLVDGSTTTTADEWWKNRFSEAEESESGGLSSNSGSSKSTASCSSAGSSRNSNAWHGGGSCWPFIFRNKRRKNTQKQ